MRTARWLPSIVVLMSTLVLLPQPASALFHLAVIDEVLSSYGGDATQQFVEIRMTAGAQSITTNSVFAAFSSTGTYLGDLLVVPGNIGVGVAGRRWTVATGAFQSAHGFAADFTMAAGIPTGGGMVCFGAPGALAPPPATWDHSLIRACALNGFLACNVDGDCGVQGPCQNSYVDCLAYGSYSGPSNVLTGTPTTAVPEGHSLRRVNDTFNNLTAFTCADPIVPENNAAATVSLPATTCCTGAPCNDGDADPCTTGLCGAGVCNPTPSSGAACPDADGNPCTNGICVSGTCTSGVRPQVSGCFFPALGQKATLVVKDNVNDAKDVLVWKWVKGAALSIGDFGTPTSTTSYTLCAYEDVNTTPVLAFRLDAPAGGTCPTKPCWKANNAGTGFNYADPLLTPNGARAFVLKSGAALASKVTAKGLGPLINIPGAALPLTTPVVVQMQSSAGKCWQANFGVATINDGLQFKAKAD